LQESNRNPRNGKSKSVLTNGLILAARNRFALDQSAANFWLQAASAKSAYVERNSATEAFDSPFGMCSRETDGLLAPLDWEADPNSWISAIVFSNSPDARGEIGRLLLRDSPNQRHDAPTEEGRAHANERIDTRFMSS